MILRGIFLLLSASWAQADKSTHGSEAEKHIQATIEASALLTTQPVCLDASSSDYHPPLCEHFCGKGTRFDTDTNMRIEYLVRRTLTYQGAEDYYRDLFAGSRKTPPPSRNELALLIDQKNSQVNARLRAYEESLAALETEKLKYPNLIKEKTEKIDQLDRLAKTPHYDDGNFIRSGLNFDQRKEYAKLVSERSKLIKEQQDNKWAIERTPTHIAVIRNQQAILGANPTEWRPHAEIKNAFSMQTQHGNVIFEFSEDTSNPEPEKIWLESSEQSKKLLCDASDQHVISERQYRASPPLLGIEHFKDWKNSLQKKMDEKIEVAESISEIAELHQKELNAAGTLKGADEVCAWIATRQPQSRLDLRQLQMEYLKSIYNTLSSQKSTLKQKLETPRDIELEALLEVINTPITLGKRKARPEGTGSSLKVYKQQTLALTNGQNQYPAYPAGGMGGYGANYGGFYGGVNGGITLDMKTSGDVAGILGKASEIFDYCVQRASLDSENKLAFDRSYDLGRSNFIYQAASYFSSPYVQPDNTQLFTSLQPHNELNSIPLYQQQLPYNNFGPSVTNGSNGYYQINSAW